MALVPAHLGAQVTEARRRLLDLIADLSDDQLVVPYLPTINPVVWEACHAAYFHEYWVLRKGSGQAPMWPDVDALFDSIKVGHENRWRLPLPDRAKALEYLTGVRDRVLELLESGSPDDTVQYWAQYSVYHEDMHTEALTYARQSLAYAPPGFDVDRALGEVSEDVSGDVEIPAGTLRMGAEKDVAFCFDNEKWAHDVELEAFAISRTAVTEGEYAAFVDDRGYDRREFWSPEGWSWRSALQAEMPLFWRRARDGSLECRHFDAWRPVDSGRAVVHVCWYEADAFARWAGRRLPTEAEWERAGAGSDRGRANMDWRGGGPVDVSACPGTDSDVGCRQMMGNVWEWTSTTFAPYPEFTPDMYEDYSQTTFHTRKILRGGGWATRSRMLRNTLRNYFQPSRRDIFAGLRTCAPTAE